MTTAVLIREISWGNIIILLYYNIIILLDDDLVNNINDE